MFYISFQGLTAGNQITLSLMTSLYRANQRVIIGKESYWAQQMKFVRADESLCAHLFDRRERTHKEKRWQNDKRKTRQRQLEIIFLR